MSNRRPGPRCRPTRKWNESFSGNRAARPARRRLNLEALEPRWLLDGWGLMPGLDSSSVLLADDTVGPNVTDIAGNPMNQDGDGYNGEAADAYAATVEFAPAVWTAPAGPGDLLIEDFKSMPPASSFWSFKSVKNRTVAPTIEGDPHGGTRHLKFDTPPYTETQCATILADLSAQAGETELWLDFWVKRVGSDYSGQTYVYLSQDGETWTWPPTMSFDPPVTYAHYAVDLDSEFARLGFDLAVDGIVHIRLQHTISNLYGIEHDVYFDDVRIVSQPPTPLAGALEVLSHDPPALPHDAAPLNTIRLTFSEAVITTSFTPEDVELKNPQGRPIPIDTITEVPGSGATQFDLAFADQNLRGEYRMIVGPAIHDMSGNPMNTDGDNISGEAQDAYSSTLNFATTVTAVPSPPETEVLLESFESWSPVPTHWGFSTEGDAIVLLDSPNGHTGTAHLTFIP